MNGDKFLYNQWTSYLHRITVRGFASEQEELWRLEVSEGNGQSLCSRNQQICLWLAALLSATKTHCKWNLLVISRAQTQICIGAFTKSVSLISYYYSFNWRCFWLREKMDVWRERGRKVSIACVSRWMLVSMTFSSRSDERWCQICCHSLRLRLRASAVV